MDIYFKNAHNFTVGDFHVRFVLRPLGTSSAVNWRADFRTRDANGSLSTQLGNINFDANADSPDEAFDIFTTHAAKQGISIPEAERSACLAAKGKPFGR